MSTDFRAQIIAPAAAYGQGDTGLFPFDLFDRQCLAQGDSWFSIGSIPPGLTSNVLAELWLSQAAVIVNCARPSKTLAHMADALSETMFLRLLRGPSSFQWDAILLSGGGNDLIDAASVGPDAPRDRRLLLRADERAAVPADAAGTPSSSTWARSSRGSSPSAPRGRTGTRRPCCTTTRRSCRGRVARGSSAGRGCSRRWWPSVFRSTTGAMWRPS
jgi:hypothetical protein